MNYLKSGMCSFVKEKESTSPSALGKIGNAFSLFLKKFLQIPKKIGANFSVDFFLFVSFLL